MTDNWHTTLRPCPRGDCVQGWNYVEDGWCGVCKGRGGIAVEVHEDCELDENECKCYGEVEEAKVA